MPPPLAPAFPRKLGRNRALPNNSRRRPRVHGKDPATVAAEAVLPARSAECYFDRSRTGECSSRPEKRSLAAPQARSTLAPCCVGCQTNPPSTSPLSPSKVMEMRDVSKSPLRHQMAYSGVRPAQIENFASVVQSD